MFDSNILIKGKHATYMKFLSEKTKLLSSDNSKNGANIFKRYVDVFMVAALFGVMNNRLADEDKTSDDRANIMAEQFIRVKLQVEFVYKIVLLNDKSINMTPDERINFVFRNNGDLELFLKYVRGGIEYLYEYFTDGATIKDDYYEKIINLIDDVSLSYKGNYDEVLSKLTGIN